MDTITKANLCILLLGILVALAIFLIDYTSTNQNLLDFCRGFFNQNPSQGILLPSL
jgi:hypothetical protein